MGNEDEKLVDASMTKKSPAAIYDSPGPFCKASGLPTQREQRSMSRRPVQLRLRLGAPGACETFSRLRTNRKPVSFGAADRSGAVQVERLAETL